MSSSAWARMSLSTVAPLRDVMEARDPLRDLLPRKGIKLLEDCAGLEDASGGIVSGASGGQ